MVSIPTTVVPETSEALVRLALRGDEAAFAQIVRTHHADMVRVAFVVCGDRDVAEEAVAAAWPMAWRRLDGLREADRLRPWLCTIAANEARRLAGARRRSNVREISADHLVASGVAESDHAAPSWVAADPAARPQDLDLAAALGRLSADDRSLLALRYVAGLSSTELGRTTGMSPSGTRARLGRLLDRLRKELEDD